MKSGEISHPKNFAIVGNLSATKLVNFVHILLAHSKNSQILPIFSTHSESLISVKCLVNQVVAAAETQVRVVVSRLAFNLSTLLTVSAVASIFLFINSFNTFNLFELVHSISHCNLISSSFVNSIGAFNSQILEISKCSSFNCFLRSARDSITIFPELLKSGLIVFCISGLCHSVILPNYSNKFILLLLI